MLAWVLTTQDVVIVRPHIKMLAGDYQCYAYLAYDRGTNPHCRMCHILSRPSSDPAPAEDLVHLLTRCMATADTRNRILPELLNIVAHSFPSNNLLNNTSHDLLTQFILDCSSINLSVDIRDPPNHPSFTSITRQCSTLIHGLHKDRTRQLKAMGLLGR